MKNFCKFVAALSAVVLVGCGGGGGSSGSNPNNPDNGVRPVASLDFQLDKSAVTNSGSDEATLTVTALDSANNPVAGAALAVNTDSGIYTPVVATTDTTGKASGKISTGSNKANRNIGFTLTLGGKTAAGVLPVTGSQITVSSVPGAPAPGAKVTLSIKLTDVNNAGIGNASVALGGSLGFSGTVRTDSAGVATAELAAAPTATGNYTVDVTGGGVTSRRDVQVVSATGGVPSAVGIISAASLAITPNTIAPNASGAAVNRAGIKALFQNASNQAINNVRVRFSIVAPGLGAGEFLSTGDAVIYTDINGVANADYVAGTRSSPTNGVVIRACYGTTDADIANGACANSMTATMTVAAEPLSITLGSNNEMAKGGDNLTYIKKFDVAVADAAGNAVSGAQISASVDLLRYGKGTLTGARFFCNNEDTNRNGLLDAGEDINRDQVLTPRKADIIISYVGSRTTGSNGRTTIQIEYPQNVATWLDYAVKVTTNVAGSEGTVEREFTTGFIEGDEENGSFLTSPYGRNVTIDACRIAG
ncbi:MULTISPECIES: Ig-like domain-containing protein [unclassified Acidovorax]|uniref:Ig-like domain-containing protein n=1 Tax=unclassified Acidovorax TaxID=2684926 RepID=UPI002882FD75|nr:MULTISPECIES: Ig-like domain-containing protein [unclassified Acidovorax]